MDCRKILGICIENRLEEAGEVQKLLTKYGCNIKTRIGLHEAGGSCSAKGVIILELCGSPEDQDSLEEELKGTAGIKLGRMVFDN